MQPVWISISCYILLVTHVEEGAWQITFLILIVVQCTSSNYDCHPWEQRDKVENVGIFVQF